MEYYLLTLGKLIVGFVIVMAYMNYMGKTQISQMTSIDLIGNFILGGIIGGVIYSETISMLQYILVLCLGIGMMSMLNIITKKFDFFRKVTIGVPIPLIEEGKFILENLESKDHKIDIVSIASTLRSQGILSFQEIRFAQIEPNGQLTVIKMNDPLPSVIIMVNGEILTSELEKIHKDQEWLDQELNKQNIQNSEDVFLAEYWNNEVKFVLNRS
ncbi:DUF421 domain-containing protein [Wohlfahrtiimonas larvae]|uniref:DUF421 domain-containing protein n=1 Tax=Wohlfahrtiimonas larvae TaxID=1157986 RepID=A0ABP9MIH2_9GAMM|nr:YetF domain-containing protein [Wohlfahrtiimonas larvae]